MTEVGVHEAKTRLSELLRDVAAGEEVVIARNGVPVARIVAERPPAEQPPRFGLLAAEISDPGDWDDDDAEALGDLFGVAKA